MKEAEKLVIAKHHQMQRQKKQKQALSLALPRAAALATLAS